MMSGSYGFKSSGRIDDGDDIRFKTMLVDAIHRQQQIINVSVYSPGAGCCPPWKSEE